MTQEQIINLVSKSRNGWERYKQDLKPCVDAYFMVLHKDTCEAKKEQKRSHIYFPKVTAKSRRITDSLSETYFTNDELAKLSKYINTSDDTLKKWQQAMDFHCVNVNLYLTFQPIFQEVPYIGTAVAKVYWDGALKIDKVDLEDFFFDPYTKTSNGVKSLVHTIYLTSTEIKRLQRSGHFNKKFRADELWSESSPNERISLQEVYFLEGEKWKVTTLYNDSVVLRENIILNDGQPFVWGGLLPQTKKFDERDFIPCYYEPAIASILPLQDETNAIRNMINDGVRQNLNPKFITSKTDGIDRSQLETIGEPVTSSNPTNIKVLESPNPSSAMNLVPVIEQDMSEVTGISPQQNGIAPNRKETATMSSIMANEGSVRLQGYIRTFNETFFEPCFQRAAILVWKYGKDEFFIGLDRAEVPSFEVKVNTGIGALNKEVQKQGLIEANGMLGQFFNMCLSINDEENARKILNASKEIIKKTLPLYGITEVDKILGEDDDRTRVVTEEVGGVSLPPQIGGSLQK